MVILRSGILISIAVVLTALLSGFSKRKDTDRPNIIWISCEDLSPHFDFYGDSTVKTPNLSKLAREGVVYENVFTTAGVCSPSRCAIITGVNQVTAGGHHMRTLYNTFPEKTGLPKSYSIVPPVDVKAFPEFLRKKGYYCTNNSKTDYQFEPPLTVWDENGTSATWRKRKPGQPFFSVFNFIVTHESQVWVRKEHPMHVDPAQVPIPPVFPDTRSVRTDVARFYSNIVDLDSLVGEVLSQLEADKLLDNTIIFFWSDHGDGLPFYKRELYDRGLHVPLIVRFPKKENGGSRDNQLISSIDLAPTVLSLAGIKPPDYMQGKAFLGPYRSRSPHEYVFAARDRMDSEYDRVRAVRDKRFKYIRNFHPELPRYQNIEYRLQQDMMREMIEMNNRHELDSNQRNLFAGTKPGEELYDLLSDPFELTNLAGRKKYETDLRRLRSVMDEWLIMCKDQGSIPEKTMIRNMWNGSDKPPQTEPVIISVSKGMVTLISKTPGASIGFKIFGKDNEDLSSWRVYDKPFPISAGQSVRAFAHRIGYDPGAESEKNF